MSAPISDRWLFLGFGLTLLAATHLISRALTHLLDLNLIHDPDYPHSAPSTPSDSIPLTTLSVLAKSPNADISRSATLLLLSRLSSPSSRHQSFLDDLFSPSLTTRRSAAQLHALFLSPAYRASVPDPVRQWRGLLHASVASESSAGQTVRAVYWHARALGEKGETRPMEQLRMLAAEMAQTESRRVWVWTEIREGEIGVWIGVMRDWADQDAKKALQAGWEPGRRMGWEGIDGERDGLPLGRNWAAARRPRLHEESDDVVDVRRRRREAMVLHEGEGLVHRNDIIQRPDDLSWRT
ncbi:hypothetical protein CAC42_5781 [Sphaceloma murrayae]|uniref:Uncharacterized protein n=1 Tax=Sphaceloma murrayae TaxID=2082308 RepID=A0A2K1QZ59_9PEZI|nr:hypothetical protein CAC42_5781 [Sphaceloma murrayae]